MRKFLLFIFSFFLLLVFSSFETAKPAQASTCSFSVKGNIKLGDKVTITAYGHPGDVLVTVGSLPPVNSHIDSGDPVDIPVEVPGLVAGQTYNVNVTPTFKDAIPCDKDPNASTLNVSGPTQNNSGTGGSSGGGSSSGVRITADPSDSLVPSTKEATEYIYGNIYGTPNGTNRAIVTENTKTVHITYSGLDPSKNYTACISTICLLLKDPKSIKNLSISNIDSLKDATVIQNPHIQDDGTLTLSLCADGEEALKQASGNDCGEEDYFHGSHIYGVLLASEDGIVNTSAFYVSRYYPKVLVSTADLPPNDLNTSPFQKIKPLEKINVNIVGTRRPHGDNYDAHNNNYAVEIASADEPDSIYSQDCITVPEGDAGATVTLDDGLPEGDYIIKINEQTHEGQMFRGGCSAEFTYYWIKIRVRNAKFWTDNCLINGHNPTCLTSIVEIIPDPNGTDVPGEKKDKPAPPPPCAVGNWDPLSSDTCPTLRTAIGNIDTAPEAFIGSVLAKVLSLAGGLAILLIIYGGYQLMASRGKPEAMEAARDQITAAIIGLLFIIFALVLLQVIGYDILKIPGFSNATNTSSAPATNSSGDNGTSGTSKH